jgi:hypothetical protein
MRSDSDIKRDVEEERPWDPEPDILARHRPRRRGQGAARHGLALRR